MDEMFLQDRTLWGEKSFILSYIKFFKNLYSLWNFWSYMVNFIVETGEFKLNMRLMGVAQTETGVETSEQ